MTDLGALYAAARGRITALVTAEGIDPDLVVPATPDWTVHDVVAHVTGVAADAMSGNMAGAPGDEWTAAQVARARDMSIADMIAAWDGTGPGVEGFLSSPAGDAASAAVMDVHSHEADLRHALGLPFDMPAEFLAWAGPAMRDGFAAQLAEAGLAPVEVSAPDAEWVRGRLGRRTEGEVRAYGWSSDPGPYLDAWFIFGRAGRSLGEAV